MLEAEGIRSVIFNHNIVTINQAISYYRERCFYSKKKEERGVCVLYF